MQGETAYTDKEFELGVLFIHGIGTHIQGQTLTASGGPLFQWIQNRCEALALEQQSNSPQKIDELRYQLDEVEWGLAGTSGPHPPSFASAGPNAAHKALIRRAVLQKTLFKDPTDSAAPGHTKMTILSLEHDERVTEDRWLLAESWWANCFSPPTFKELALWALRVLPWILASHFGAHVQRRFSERPKRPPDSSLKAQRARLKYMRKLGLWLWRLTTAIGGLALAQLSTVVLAPILLGLLLLGAIPISKLRKALLGIQLKMAATVGDCYVFVSLPIEAASIVNAVRQDLLWLASRCSEIVIVAHSQGGAVAHFALRGSIPRELRLLFTYGSGLRKLEELKELSKGARPRAIGAIGTIIALIVFLFFGWAFLIVIFGNPKPSPSELLGGLWVPVLAFAFCAAGIRAEIRGIKLPELEHWIAWLKSTGLRWIDCYASADPVPNGIVAPSARCFSREVCNRSSMFADHTSYWTNSDQFLSLLFGEIAKSCANGRYRDLCLGGKTFTQIIRRRFFRVAIGRTIQWIGIAGLLIVVARNWPACQNVVSWGWMRVGVFLSSIFGIETSNPRSFAVSWTTIGFLALVLVPYGIVRMIWTSWNNWEMQWALGVGPERWFKEWQNPASYYVVIFGLFVRLYIVVSLAVGRYPPPSWVFFVSFIAVMLFAAVNAGATGQRVSKSQSSP